MKLVVPERNMRVQGKESCAVFAHSDLHFACKKETKINVYRVMDFHQHEA